MIGSNTVIFSKCLSESVHAVFTVNSLDGPQTEGGSMIAASLLLAGFCGNVSFWLLCLNYALRTYPALYIVPALQSVWMCCTIVGGGIFFREFDNMSNFDLVGFFIGVAIVLTGVVLMPAESSKSVSSVVTEPQVAECSLTPGTSVP